MQKSCQGYHSLAWIASSKILKETSKKTHRKSQTPNAEI